MKEPLEFESLDQMAETTGSALVKAAAESAFICFMKNDSTDWQSCTACSRRSRQDYLSQRVSAP